MSRNFSEATRLRTDPVARSQFTETRPPLARKSRKPPIKVPPEVQVEVRKRSKGRCIVCLFDGRPKAGRAEHLHHGLPKGVHGWPQHAKQAANLMGVCAKCHDLHERAIRRIPREALPACFVEFCERLGDKAVAYLERTYPLATKEA